jgi:predicted small lipoprotein YifL
MIRIKILKSAIPALIAFTLALAVVSLSACGQKGPLYLPAEQSDQNKKKESEGG